MKVKKALLIGCGDLGIRTAQHLIASGYEVTGARRSTEQLPTNIKAMRLDVTDSATFTEIDQYDWDVVIVTLTARGEDAYKAVYVDGLSNLLLALNKYPIKPLLLFASSTSVYAQNDGSIVTENSPTEPSGYSGKTMLVAENLLQASGFPHAIIRFSGIYGPYRGGHLLAVLKSGRICPREPMRYSNRIHIEDCARAFMHLIDRYAKGQPSESLEPVYIGTDNASSTLREVMEWLANKNAIALPTLTEDYLPERGGNKQLKGEHLLASGFSFKYPSYQLGYSD